MVYKLTISYIGTAYCGWQVQPELPTVQNTIELLLAKIFGQKINLRYSSRTDSGVHALEQVASFASDKTWLPNDLRQAMNTQLPEDIVIINVLIMNDEFDARHASKKTYFYLINNTNTRNPFELNRSWWLKHKLDLSKMQKAINYLLGEHDFSAFMGSGSSIKTTIRTIYEIDLLENNGNIKFTVTANGFLKHMVRNIVGTLVEIGRKRFEPEDLEEILNSRDRKKAGMTAPPYGLYLEKVYYE